MELDHLDLRKGIGLGLIAGIIWGWISMSINAMTGAFPFENSIIYNLITFSIGGIIIGIVVGAFMAVSLERLPFNRPLYKAVLLSTSLWLTLRIGGFFLSLNDPARYHPTADETIQGFVLAIILGCILGALWELREKTDN